MCNPLTTFGDKKLSEKLANLIRAVNKIKTKALNSRLFHQLCIDNDDDFQCFLLHIEVRWLSKGNCLTRLFTLFYTTLDFFEEVDNNLKKRIAFLTLNSADWKEQTSKSLTVFSYILKSEYVFVGKVQGLNVPNWVPDPFRYKRNWDMPIATKEELLTLKNDFEMKPLFKTNYQKFWLKSEVQDKSYRTLWKEVELIFIAFPKSYLEERGFSDVTRLTQRIETS